MHLHSLSLGLGVQLVDCPFGLVATKQSLAEFGGGHLGLGQGNGIECGLLCLANIGQCGSIQRGASNELGTIGVGEMIHSIGRIHVFIDALLDEVVQLYLLFGILKVGGHWKHHIGYLAFGFNEVTVA